MNTINTELVIYFIEALAARADRSAGTIANIKRDLEKLIEYIDSEYSGEISADAIRAYVDELKANYMETSYVSKASSIRQFVAWLNLSDNPFWDMKISLSNEDFKYYSHDDIFVHSMGCVREPYAKALNRLILGFIYEFHLTLSELAELCVEDYNLASGALMRRGLEIAASPKLKADMKEYLRSRGDLALGDRLIQDESGVNLSVADLRLRLTEMELRPVYLRRSRVIHLLEAGLSTEDIETMLGIKLGQVYEDYEQEPDYRLLKAYNQFHPRGDG